MGFRCCPKHSNCCVYLPKHPKPLFPALPQSPARRLWLFTCPPAAGQIRTLAQRVVEVAGSALVTRVPFKSRSTQTLPCLAVTGAIILTRARALTGWKATRALVNKQLISLSHILGKGTRGACSSGVEMQLLEGPWGTQQTCLAHS